MVLYSSQSLNLMGVSDVQMESLVSASIASVNEAFANSEIGIDLTIVNQTMVRENPEVLGDPPTS